MESGDQLLDRLGAEQSTLWTERLPGIAVQCFVVWLVSFCGAGVQPAPAIVQHVCRCLEKVSLGPFHGLDVPAARKMQEYLLNQVINLSAPAEAFLEKASEGDSKATR